MTKQAIIENILDRFVLSKELQLISIEWKAFYNSPMDYKNTEVPAMVNMFLDERRK